MSDIRSNRAVFVSHCVLAQCVRANGLVKQFPGPVRPVLEWALAHDINIMQMPCPETICAAGGLGRDPHGKDWYERNGLRETAKKIACGQVAYMEKLLEAGVNILAIIGMDFSPACAVNHLNKGPVIYSGKGIYIEELESALQKGGLRIPMIGIKTRALKKLQKELLALTDTSLFGKAD